MYNVSETVLPIYINGQCPIIKTCSDVTLNLSSKDSKLIETLSYNSNRSSRTLTIKHNYVEDNVINKHLCKVSSSFHL